MTSGAPWTWALRQSHECSVSTQPVEEDDEVRPCLGKAAAKVVGVDRDIAAVPAHRHPQRERVAPPGVAVAVQPVGQGDRGVRATMLGQRALAAGRRRHGAADDRADGQPCIDASVCRPGRRVVDRPDDADDGATDRPADPL